MVCWLNDLVVDVWIIVNRKMIYLEKIWYICIKYEFYRFLKKIFVSVSDDI